MSAPPPPPAQPPAGRRITALPVPPPLQVDFPVVGIGASAGGLEACRRLLDAMPPSPGLAFILVQHLDPTHQSLMVELLATHTPMTVLQATSGMRIAPNHLYVIPPGAYLSVKDGALLLSEPAAPHGTRLPFDFLLRSMAEAFGRRAVCVILSGMGGDGSAGVPAIKQHHGFIIVQKPEDAGYDGMPRNAIRTGDVDVVLPIAEIPQAILGYAESLTRTDAPEAPDASRAPTAPPAALASIIDLLRTRIAHDFTLYKPGTLERRIGRRMAMAGLDAGAMDLYLEMLKGDADELKQLAKDLLIHVTSFFRDPQVFDQLAESILPGMIRSHAPGDPLRIWIAGCSTGEETYSLAMLVREQLAAAKINLKLQVFASDVDPDAIASAREGLYPESIEANVSAARLERFFSKEGAFYRVLPDLRATVVFTVQDVLADPPFSRLDLISCRNLLIYLRPEAQARVISLFHFALRQGGILLLGNAETVGSAHRYFEVISKSARLYRHLYRNQPSDVDFTLNPADAARLPVRPGQERAPSRQTTLAELCRRLVLETYAPAAILINGKHECLYSLGPIDRYLRMAPGMASHDVLAMARPGMRLKLRQAIEQARHDKAVVISGGHVPHNGDALSFNIEVHPVPSEQPDLLLLCFVDAPPPSRKQPSPVTAHERPRVAELEHELEVARAELQSAGRKLEIFTEEQSAINEDALSVNEEYQSTNEELLASKEELQSLNEELTALNGQLQETLERQRTLSNDLQNVLYSTDVPTLFLDIDLNIRFFTPATKSLFNVIPGDIGRPLADLNSLAIDSTLTDDAHLVISNLAPLEREIQMRDGVWFIRRIQPYRTPESAMAGVVITFIDVTERKRVRAVLEDARHQAEVANQAKSRFLAAASHDLRQPLQTLALLQGVLAKTVESDKAKALIGRLDETLGSISGMLNTLLDINEIETGSTQAEVVDFPINTLLQRLHEEFSFHAEALGLTLHVVACSTVIRSDPRLLEQMLRNLLSNALKYTKQGKVLLGCRRHPGMLSIEVWDTGAGIPDQEMLAIFEEYHQLDNAARERSRGLGLGLSIVQRLGSFLGHKVRVRSIPGKGSGFSIEILMPAMPAMVPIETKLAVRSTTAATAAHRAAEILLIEDDPNVRDLLALLLTEDGHKIAAVPDGEAAVELVARGTIMPDLILTDYNLPHGMDGVHVAAKLREELARPVPVIVLTGDISKDALRNIALQNSVMLNKPVKPAELTKVIQRLLPQAPAVESPVAPVAPVARLSPAAPSDAATIYVIDDERQVREAIRTVFETAGYAVETYTTAEDFLADTRPQQNGCLLIDAYLPGMGGLELLQKLTAQKHHLPAIMITGNSDVPMAVQAMKSGAADFIDKPVSHDELLASVTRALERSQDSSKLSAWQDSANKHIASLTERQHQIMELVLAGHPSKNIAADLGISQRTVENHRASIMRKTGSKSLPALARLALAAEDGKNDGDTYTYK